MTTRTKEKPYVTLHDLLVAKMSALYDVEQQLVKALSRMAKAASDPELKQGFEEHLEETKDHVVRLEDAFRALNASPEKKIISEGIRGIIKDASGIIDSMDKGAARDATLIAAASYAEYYEMAGYRAAYSWAGELGLDDAADFLDQNLQEEIAADQRLSDLAIGGIDERANLEPVEMEAD